jgi:hypothetical protein
MTFRSLRSPFLALASALLALLLCPGCGGGGGATLPPATAPVVTGQPGPQVVALGQPVSFYVTGSGNPAPTIQWTRNQVYIGGATGISYTIPVTVKADDGASFQAVLSNSQGSVLSNAVTLSVQWSPAVTTQPAGQTVAPGTLATFSAAADGGPVPACQWQRSGDGGQTWSDLAGATQTTLKLTATVADDSAQYRARFSNLRGTAASDPALLRVIGAASSLDPKLTTAYLTQGSQVLAGNVPLVAGRDALLRVFPVANQINALNPLVHVDLRNGGATLWQADLRPAASSLPTLVNEANAADSCNVVVPGSFIQPGCTLALTLDPFNTLLDSDRSNNSLTLTPVVQTVKTLKLTLVPVTQQSLTGNVTAGRTLASWTDRVQRMYPLATVDLVQAGGLVTSANLNTADTATKDGAGWSQALRELETKRVVEASDRIYFGVVKVSYSGGTAGIGYVPNSPLANHCSGLAWDKTGYQDGGNYPEVLAHELGHIFGRYHAPCGVTDPDPAWPADPAHAGALIGAWGWDYAAGSIAAGLKSPAIFEDIMSYCHGDWVSDYTYKGILDWRAAGLPLIEAATEAPLQECLVVSGSITGGRIELAGSYLVRTRALPETGGSCRLTLEDGNGRTLREAAFEPTAIADLDGAQGDGHFVLAIPVDAAQKAALAGIRVRRGQEPALLRTALAAPDQVREPVAVALGAGRVHLGWDHGVHPFVMVRDAATGEVLGFLRDGSATLASTARELEVTFSDGVRSLQRRLPVQD